jgi:hypothetical protein
MTNQKRREWLVQYAGMQFNGFETVSLAVTVDPRSKFGGNGVHQLVHAREALPGDLLLSAEEVEKIRSLLSDIAKNYIGHPDDIKIGRIEWAKEALAIIDSKRGGE